jgi:hypothetical protein
VVRSGDNILRTRDRDSLTGLSKGIQTKTLSEDILERSGRVESGERLSHNIEISSPLLRAEL